MLSGGEALHAWEAGSGKREAASGKREAASGKRQAVSGEADSGERGMFQVFQGETMTLCWP
jgi:hypothetical protein